VRLGEPAPVNAPSFLDPDAVKKLVTGGPDWIYTDRYTIEANTSGTAPPTAMVGPMLRALLEERLRLTLHQDQRQIPAYSLTVANGGFKLSPADPGSCRSSDPNPPGSTGLPAPGEKPSCANSFGRDGPNVTWKGTGVTLDQIAQGLGMLIGRPVIDRTGIVGQFTFKAEFDRGDGVIRTNFPNPDPEEVGNPTTPGPTCHRVGPFLWSWSGSSA
jgi:uncharacterized protein (TIGR03435 family)